MKNRLANVSDEQFQRCLSFAMAHPRIVSVHHLLQKLTIYDFVAPLVQRSRAGRILEVGCGLGIHSALLSHLADMSATELAAPGSFVGADADVEDARRKVFGALGRGRIAFAYNDGRSIPFADGSFDLVFHNSVIEHVPDVLAFNREVRRVLRPGGVCICITGTPALCWLRFALGSVVKLPLNVGLAVARELLPARSLQAGARWLLARAGAGDETILKAHRHLASVADKAKAVADAGGGGAARQPDLPGLRSMYPRLRHCLDAPGYNRMVFNQIACELDLSGDQLAPQVHRHFAHSFANRLRYWLAPRTHGQHYRDWLEEKREWKVDRWIDRFVAAGFAVEEVQPYRFHHLLEATPRRKWDAYTYYFASPLLHALLRRGWMRPSWGSEIILVARKPALREGGI